MSEWNRIALLLASVILLAGRLEEPSESAGSDNKEEVAAAKPAAELVRKSSRLEKAKASSKSIETADGASEHGDPGSSAGQTAKGEKHSFLKFSSRSNLRRAFTETTQTATEVDNPHLIPIAEPRIKQFALSEARKEVEGSRKELDDPADQLGDAADLHCQHGGAERLMTFFAERGRAR